ncbi:unnamed protein product [Allacma fusca]|uniref:Uncharacterized protein n=1 Tax=Allacma fusca TaxID=39272 RepID=A0A8J2K4Z6_9HEXA|nr:unnamed protein product [Allacma fusca]
MVNDVSLLINTIKCLLQCRSEYSTFGIESDQHYMYAAICDSEDNFNMNFSLPTTKKLDVFSLKTFGLTFKFGSISTALVFLILLYSLLEKKNYPEHHRAEFRALEAFLYGNLVFSKCLTDLNRKERRKKRNFSTASLKSDGRFDLYGQNNLENVGSDRPSQQVFEKSIQNASHHQRLMMS